MTNAERIDHIEDELEIVKQLLISSASYAESANKRIDRLIERQDVTQRQLDGLAVSVQVMSETTQRQLDGLAVSVQVMSEKIDRFIDSTSNFIDTTQARNAVLDGVVLELRDNQQSTNAAIERLERILEQLIRRNE